MNQIIYVGRHALTMTVSRHTHTSWELIFCTSGGGRLIFDNMTLEYKTNDIAIIPPFIPHSNRSEEGFTNIHINLTETTFSDPEPLIVAADHNGFLLNAFTAAFYYYSKATQESPLLLSSYGQLIAAFLTSRQAERPHNRIVSEIENSILQNYPDCSYDLSAYLGSLPFNSEYLKKLFKKDTGMTPHQYLTNKRLESAANALTVNCGKGSVSETANLCGFGEPLYFSRLFKKKYGVSPRDYPPKTQKPRIMNSDSMKIFLPDV